MGHDRDQAKVNCSARPLSLTLPLASRARPSMHSCLTPCAAASPAESRTGSQETGGECSPRATQGLMVSRPLISRRPEFCHSLTRVLIHMFVTGRRTRLLACFCGGGMLGNVIMDDSWMFIIAGCSMQAGG